MTPAFLARWFTPAPDSGVADDLRRGKSPWADSVHLLWSAWIFVTPLFERGTNSGYTRTWLLLTFTSYPVFLLLFARLQLAPRRTAYRYAWAMAALSFGLLHWYTSSLTYFVYACVMVNLSSQPLRARLLQLALLNALLLALGTWAGYPVAILLIMLFMVLVISAITLVERVYHEKDAALRLSQDEVRRLAVLAERERIGRDLHDLLGHTLSLVTLKSELARKLALADPPRAQREMEEVERVSRHALAEVRAAVTGMRRSDLAAELVSARLMLEASGIAFEADAPATCELRPDAEASLALVLREAVTNIHRHARATAARVDFSSNPESFHMRISDNGRGGLAAHGNGISGMRERVRALGGTLAIDSPARRGTTLDIAVPLRGSARPVAEGMRGASPLLAGQEGAA
ncbi:histidine kinase [Frateuria sp. Soil773]|uniref:sensor histidine kinase n=1 Tax=Frateuria sp. Soil773 TaxID=1736407 RepID=UPI0006F3320A|nr:sensor histidine kinase [Frateuria sp. Soil773]KRE88455.1 histidine kinase [Frateuria sp. Soil773]